MKKTSMTILSLVAMSGAVFGQTAAMLVTPGANTATGSHRFVQNGRPTDFKLCTFEICRPNADGILDVQRIAAGSPSTIVAQASNPEEENFLVFYPVGREGIPEARRILRKRYLVTLKEGANLAAIKSRCGIKNIELVSADSNLAICEEESAGRVLSQVSNVLADPDIVSAEPLLARQRVKRAIPTDPFYPATGRADGQYQWYLNNTGQNGGVPDIDINLEGALDLTRGTGVNIAIVDDGLATDHLDLAANAVGPHIDLVDGDNDPATFDDTANHGTNVAGLAGAVWNNGQGMSGVAPASVLSGVRLFGGAGFVDDLDESRALGFSTNIIDVSNNSWGPDDTTLDFEEPGTLTLAALRSGATTGRVVAGTPRGVVYVWSGGNGGVINDNSNYDGYANSIYTIAVGAVTDAGRKAVYSERGANLVVSAPSSGGSQNVLTTQFGLDLDEDDNIIRTSEYITNFAGTSAATPLVSGVVALMLQINPNLSWRDVQDILMRTATTIDPDNGGWNTNAAGIDFNHDYGAGLVNATAAVQEAARPGKVLLPAAATPQLKSVFFQQDSPDINVPTGIIPDGTGSSYQVTFDFSAQPNLNVEHVQLVTTIITERRSDLELVLISPSGTQSILQEVNLTHQEQSIASWAFMTVRNWGEDSAGTWILRVTDRITGNPAIINNANLVINGALDPAGSVVPTPLLISNQLITADQGSSFTYRVETVGATGVTVGDLPAGVSYNPTTRVISGSPSQPGVFSVPLQLTAPGLPTGTPRITIVVRPTSVALGSAIGLPGYPAFTGGEIPWDFEFTDTNDIDLPLDQRRAARSGEGLGNNEKSIFGFNGLPKGILMFDWKTSSEEGADRLWFNLGGDIPQTWKAFISGERDWGTTAVILPQVSNRVQWIYSKDGPNGTAINSVGKDRGLVDNVRIIDSAKYLDDVRSAGNITGINLEFDSRMLWMPIEFAGQSTPPTPGGVGTALRTSTIGNGQTVSMSAWLDGPGTLSFTSRNFAATEDLFEFLIDGVVVRTQVGSGAVGPVDTLNAVEAIRPGRHRLQLRFRKDFRGSNARSIRGGVFDGVLLDELKFVPTNNFNSFATSFGPTELLPNEDEDGDGYSNFEEYAFGGNVLVSDIPSSIPKLLVSGNSRFIEFGVDKTNLDVNYIPQQSVNLSNWAPAQFSRLDRVEGNIEYYQIPVINVPGRDTYFYRVLVQPK